MGNLNKYSLSEDDIMLLRLPEPVTASSIINCLKINSKEIGFVVVNSEYVDVNANLTSGSLVKLFPVLTGG